MTSGQSPFDDRPDPALGAALRSIYAVSDDEAFLARFRLALAAEADRASSVEVLGRWAWPGVAAAAVLALGLGLLIGRVSSADPTPTLADAVAPSGVPSQLLSTAQPASRDLLLAVVIE